MLSYTKPASSMPFVGSLNANCADWPRRTPPILGFVALDEVVPFVNNGEEGIRLGGGAKPTTAWTMHAQRKSRLVMVVVFFCFAIGCRLFFFAAVVVVWVRQGDITRRNSMSDLLIC